uniref:cytosolic carboxypeptidase-like protein 5 n=1 Tax=Vespula vulgaris TaxID=7454 RepID=UPI00223AB3C6|nr:cytosolic carboxypeptidase-like protein 5 [Vespula vulgaris]XP_050855961.1 cytosolic carboxypeptidase-like protein 5 [Vespula vulgaris]
MAENINCGGFVFYNNFDSANLAKVELVRVPEICNIAISENETRSCKSLSSDDTFDYEFNLWTKYDCHGTEYQNNNRTWFYFGVKACSPGICVRLNIVNLNKQVRMFSQGMCPVYKIIPGQLHWERIHDRPTYKVDQTGSDFMLSFTYYTPENQKAVTYFAFTYPFSYTDLQNYLKKIDIRMAKHYVTSIDDIYYHRECAIKSLEGRRLDVLTISSYHNILNVREDRFDNMFPEKHEERPFKFLDKKVVFISARVHPGETPSSFVLNGFLKFLLNREDQIALHLRRMYVFKLIPMLNPDGVAKGHYRMDTKGVNLNRMYLNPSEKDHPTIYAARNLIRYYHHSYNIIEEQLSPEIESTCIKNKNNIKMKDIQHLRTNVICNTPTRLLQRVKLMTLNERAKSDTGVKYECMFTSNNLDNTCCGEGQELSSDTHEYQNILKGKYTDKTTNQTETNDLSKSSSESGLYLYIDLHGHASKKGVFMYGNHFTDPEDTIMCMLLPKLMSINNPNFHFTSCNFAERNMYLIDKRDGMSREGSGRVAVYKMTGLIRSYTLECNYNSGRLVNIIPARIRDGISKTTNHLFVPPKYTPTVFEAVGAALGPSILDLTNNNPNSRLPNSQYRSLRGVRSYLKLTQMNSLSASCNKSAYKVLYCMPPPFTSSLALCQLAQADLPTSVVTTLIGHFGGFFLSPILLYFVLGASTPPLVGVNVKEIIYSTLLPLIIGMALQFSVINSNVCSIIGIGRYSRGLLLIIAYYWFSDAVSADVSSLQAIDILLCILIACIAQLFTCCLYWGLCSRWLPRNILLAALFVSTHKSVGLGSWILRSTYHGSAQGPAVNLPLSILPVAQLVLGTLLASWIAPQYSLQN